MERKPSKNNKKYGNKIEKFSTSSVPGGPSIPMYIWIPLLVIVCGIAAYFIYIFSNDA
tara:strand:- start:1001 stop:1174 length:174 start_codon:yes stop_codon:yes gene_type:complete